MKSRRDFLYGLGTALPLSLWGETKAVQNLNVLFIGVDDFRPQLGCFGDRFAHTPNVDAIANRGTAFHQTYCQQALCGPSRASLLTGLRPDTIRVYDLNTRFRDAAPDAVTLPQLFKRHGYFTQNIGKIFHGNPVMSDPVSWSVPAQLNMVTKRDQYFLQKNKGPKDAWRKASATECADVWDTAYIDGRIAEASVASLRKMKGRPFFLAVGFNKPHLPFAAPKRYWELFDRRKVPMPLNPYRPRDCPPFAFTPYDELRSYGDVADSGPLSGEKIREVIHGYYAAAYTDANIGKVIDELTRLGLRDNTIVVLWADHGWHLGEEYYWGKTTNFEVATRVPLVVSVPGKRRQSTNSLVEVVDIYPTLAELCRLRPPGNLQGKSFVPLLDNALLSGKAAACSQYPRKQASTGGERYMGYTMRTSRYRYTEWLAPDRSLRGVELYNHQTDPNETRNVAMLISNKESIAALSAMMHRDLSLAPPTNQQERGQ